MKKLCIYLSFFALATFESSAQPVISLTPVITGLSAPVDVVSANDGTNRFFVVQQGGTIRVFSSTFASLGTFLTVTGVSTGGERGLLSLVFHPNYASNGFFFVFYTNGAGNLEISRYRISTDPNVADVSSRVIVLTIPHPGASNHNGGRLLFGADGLLYLSTGDGGGAGDQANNAQNPSVLLGKMLRISVNTSATAPFYSIPAGNPFGNEVWALGLRNPFRWSFDRQTQDVWIGDVGQNAWEEINFVPAGAPVGRNFGWRCYEGNNPYNLAGCGPVANYTFPIYTYPISPPPASVIGGVVYRGTAFPGMFGYYIACDFYSGNFYKIRPDGSGWNVTVQNALRSGIAAFGESESGELFAAGLTTGTVYRVQGTIVTGIADPSQPGFRLFAQGKSISVFLDQPWKRMELLQTGGAKVAEVSLAGRTGRMDIPLASLPAGIYIARVYGTNRSIVVKFLLR
ncbi:MAG TPA: PQQ-dependent sugar dehydrogenase [Chitinophagaceae bacterium]|nr:PQQ-dependent sugar dehydrogenase [Chitinophagaceae bacterium]